MIVGEFYLLGEEIVHDTVEDVNLVGEYESLAYTKYVRRTSEGIMYSFMLSPDHEILNEYFTDFDEGINFTKIVNGDNEYQYYYVSLDDEKEMDIVIKENKEVLEATLLLFDGYYPVVKYHKHASFNGVIIYNLLECKGWSDLHRLSTSHFKLFDKETEITFDQYNSFQLLNGYPGIQLIVDSDDIADYKLDYQGLDYSGSWWRVKREVKKLNYDYVNDLEKDFLTLSVEDINIEYTNPFED